MPDTTYLITAVALCTVLTWSLRAAPFAALTSLRESAVIHHLSAHMPVGVLTILAVYTLQNLPLAARPETLATGLALAVTLGLHLWRHNAVLSILGGTAAHVALASTVLAS